MTDIKKTEQEKVLEELMSYKEIVFQICLGFSKNPWDAEDLTQDVYLKAFRNIHSLSDPCFLKEWLFKIARNTCFDFGRKLRIRRIFQLKSKGETQEDRTPESLVAYGEQLQVLKKAVNQLPEKHKEVFVLREYGNLSYQEIAAVLGIKNGTVMSRLKRARQAVINQTKEEVQ